MDFEYTEDELQASICRSSFWEFVKHFWHTVVPEKPIWNWHIPFLCQEIQTLYERIFKGLPYEYDWIGNVPPGTSKSTIFSVLAPAWAWTRMPSFRFLGTSHSGRLANDLGRKCRDVVTSEPYKKLFPDIRLKDDVDAKFYFGNTKGGIRYSVGTGSSPLGFHFHFIGIDDPIDPQKAVSEADLANANHFITQTLPSRKVDMRLTPMGMIMQRLRQGDPTDVFKGTSHNCRHIILPAELHKDHPVQPPELANCYVEGLMDPVRLNREVLARQHNRLKDYGYAGQYQQYPVPAGGGMFKTKKLNYGTPPAKFRRIIRVWDKAATFVAVGKKNKGSAYTAGVKMGQGTDGRIWVLDVKRFQLDSWSRDRQIRQTAVKDGYFVFVGFEVEPGSGGKDSYAHTARQMSGFKLRPFPASGAKEDRADPFSSHVNSGHVWIAGDPDDEWVREYVEEMKYWPFSTYLDQIDASAHAYNFLSRAKIKVGGAF